MTCANYMGQSCGIGCCLARAEQFAFIEHNEPEFAEFCPLVQRYGNFYTASKPRRQLIRVVTGHRVVGSSRTKSLQSFFEYCPYASTLIGSSASTTLIP